MLPPAPARLSMITAWPSSLERRSAKGRAMPSKPPPGGCGCGSCEVQVGKVDLQHFAGFVGGHGLGRLAGAQRRVLAPLLANDLAAAGEDEGQRGGRELRGCTGRE